MTTNRDKINAMTNKELAILLNRGCVSHCIRASLKGCLTDYKADCIDGTLKWLESEVKE